MWVKSIQVMAQGYGHKSGEGSEAQLGGVFIIDTSGKVAYAHIAADAADHPSPQDILQAAATLSGKVAAPPTDPKPVVHRGNPLARAAGEASVQPEAIKSGKAMAFVAYVFFPIPLFAGACRRNAFVMYHTRQAILPAILSIAGVALAMGGALALSRTSPITIAGSVLHGVMFVLLLVGAVYALNGKVRPLPLLGRLTASLHLLR
jgi:hypothetical protein